MMNNIILKCVAGFSLLMMLGCASKAPESSVYLLPNPSLSENHPTPDSPTLNIASVHLSEFLSTRGFVIEMGENEVVVTQNHRWAESLEESILRHLRRSIRSESFRVASVHDSSDIWDFQLHLEFDSFQSRSFDSVYTSGRWNLLDLESSETVLERYFELSTTTTLQNYEGIVQAYSNLLVELSQQIIRAIESSIAEKAE